MITCLPKESRRDFFTLYIDEEPWRDIHASIFGRKPNIPGNVKDLAELEECFSKLELQLCKNYVLRRLAAKSYHSEELKKNLRERAVSANVVQYVLQECAKDGYLDDEDWVRRFIRSQVSRRLGPQAIAMKLRKKGIPSHQIESVMKELHPPESQKEQIGKLLTTKYKTRDLANFKEKQKVIGGLMRKGFDFQEIAAALKIDWQD